MKKLLCAGLVALALGAKAQQNDPPLNVWASNTVSCDSSVGPCQYGYTAISVSYKTTCMPGNQPSCTAVACAKTAIIYVPC
jgi:hypothetical protein